MVTRIAALCALAAGLAAAAPPLDDTRADVDRGHHLATVMGCTSCHGSALDGHLFEENAAFALAWSSNLSRILPGWTDAQIAATLRTGRRPDRTPLWFMPTFAQRHLTDADMAALIAWLRTVPPSGGDHPSIQRGPRFGEALAHGFQDSAAQAERLATRQPADVGAQDAGGRYLVGIACAECHGPDLTGARDPQLGDPPDLTVAAGYAPRAFARLLRTGIKQDGRPADGMAEEARKRLSVLSDAEIAAIRSYLLTRATQAR